MVRPNSSMRSDSYGRVSMRVHSPTLAYVIPYLSITLGSLLPAFAFASAMPIIPPLGFMFLIAWRLMRPGFLPMWAGLPLGLFDDLFSGQPLGSAMFLWSIAMITIEFIEARWPWRGLLSDWLTSGTATTLYILLALGLSGTLPNLHLLYASLPQILAALLLYPVIARIVAILDRFRLRRFKALS